MPALSINNNLAGTTTGGADDEKRTINPRSFDDLLRVSEFIRREAPGRRPEVGIICGSGLGGLADQLTDTVVVPYSKIPGFFKTHVAGHKGNLVFGRCAGREVVALQGRFHPYEHGMDLALCAFPVRILHQLGVKLLIVSNAAGGINQNFQFGDLMVIKDHLFLPGLSGFSPLVGLNDERFGARFVSVHDSYDKELRKLALRTAAEKGVRVHQGIYAMSGGPQYETPAEVSMLKAMGADAVGMSTCHEVTVARQCGISVLGISLITNIANLDADSSVVVSHEEVLQTAKMASDRATGFVASLIERIAL